jgi:Sulfotransferase domain
VEQGRIDSVIAGVNKAGTTSLFVALSAHPDVAPSAIKETRYFTPARYGQPLEPPSVWESYFADAPATAKVRLEATPSYFYGGARVASRMSELLRDPHVILVLREPVSRAISFFTYQKVRLRIPADLPIAEYLATADALGPDAFLDPDNEPYFAFRGGCYADYLPEWLETLGPERLCILDFHQLVTDEAAALRTVAEWLGIDPSAFPADHGTSENRTTSYRNARLQQVALAGNDRLERVFRRHPDAKRRLRALYYRINGRSAAEEIPAAIYAELEQRYREPNARLARQLETAGIALPAWLAAQTESRDPA